jgi:hypothetical protein
MPYKEYLNRWLVVRLLADMQRVTVAHFRSRSDADGYLQAICRLEPKAEFRIIFNPDLPPEFEAESEN